MILVLFLSDDYTLQSSANHGTDHGERPGATWNVRDEEVGQGNDLDD